MKLILGDKQYLRDLKVCLELRTGNKKRFYGEIIKIPDELCAEWDELVEIKQFLCGLKSKLFEKSKEILTSIKISLDLGWFIDWEKDCYCLGYIREKGKGHKIIGYYSKHNLPNCFWHYINNMVYKSDLNGKNQIIDGFNKYYEVVKSAIDEHDNWDILEKPEAAKPAIPKVRKSGGGQMKLAYNFKRKN